MGRKRLWRRNIFDDDDDDDFDDDDDDVEISLSPSVRRLSPPDDAFNCVCVQNLPDATERGVLRFFSERIGDCVDAIVPVDERSGNTKVSPSLIYRSRARGKLPKKPARDASTRRRNCAFEF